MGSADLLTEHGVVLQLLHDEIHWVVELAGEVGRDERQVALWVCLQVHLVAGAGGGVRRGKGHEAFRRYSEHVAKGVMELMTVPVKVHTREFVDRVM